MLIDVKSEDIKLEFFTKKDFSLLINWIDSEKELIQFAGSIFSYPLTDKQLEKYIKETNRHIYKVICKRNNNVIGHSEIYLPDKETAHLCRILIGESKFRGKGLGQKLIKELVRISFHRFGVKKVMLNVYDWNSSAINCYKNSGFTVNMGKINKTIFQKAEWTAINMVLHKGNWDESY